MACSQARKRPGRALRWDTLDARSFIVDACVAHQNAAALTKVYTNAQRREYRQLREIARKPLCAGDYDG
jgi:hypothetical protein